MKRWENPLHYPPLLLHSVTRYWTHIFMIGSLQMQYDLPYHWSCAHNYLISKTNRHIAKARILTPRTDCWYTQCLYNFSNIYCHTIQKDSNRKKKINTGNKKNAVTNLLRQIWPNFVYAENKSCKNESECNTISIKYR